MGSKDSVTMSCYFTPEPKKKLRLRKNLLKRAWPKNTYLCSMR